MSRAHQTRGRVELRLPAADLRRWRAAAAADGAALSEWIRQRCDDAAQNGEKILAAWTRLVPRRARRRKTVSFAGPSGTPIAEASR